MSWFSVFNVMWKITEKSDAKNHATQSLPEGIKEENGFAYINDNNKYHLLDVYYPEKNDGKLPVIIDVHGGGWMYGDKELNKIYCEYLAARGFIVFNMSYRLVPEVLVDEQLRDVSAAIKWINDNLDRFPADRSRIMLTGDSAGGMLAAFTGVLSCSEEARKIYGTADFGIKFNCVALTSPVSYMNEESIVGAYCRLMWGEAPFKSCTRQYLNLDEIIDLAPDYPPTLMITSSGDILALKQTRKAHEMFMKKGLDSVLYDTPKYDGKNLPHVYAVLRPMDEPGVKCIDKMAEFFRQHF